MQRPCRYCDRLGHTAFICPQKPKKALKTNPHCSYCDGIGHTRMNCLERSKTLKQVVPTHEIDAVTGRYPDLKRGRKALKKNGKYAALWLQTRHKWLALNPPNHQGYYICYLCKKYVPEKEMTLDHIKSRVRYPELRFELSNLSPSCAPCNNNKGSKDLHEL